MDFKKTYANSRNRFPKLSLKRNKVNSQKDTTKHDRSCDVIVLDESFDRLRLDFPKNVQVSPKIHSPFVINDSCDLIQQKDLSQYDIFTKTPSKAGNVQVSPKIHSPIVINDSCELVQEEDLSQYDMFTKTPSKAGNVSLNSTKEMFMSPCDSKPSRPSIGGWSPAQTIICATPKHETIPSTPNDVANESLEQCSMKKIELSHKKLLSELYGDKWKTIPTLFKSTSQNHDNLNGISEKLQFNDDDESDKENIRHDLIRNRELYLTASERKLQGNKELDLCDTEKKSKKKLYTEKIPNTPEPKKIKNKTASSTTKKWKGLTITEMFYERLNNRTGDVATLTNKAQGVLGTPVPDVIQRLSFLGSLADNVPSRRCHIEALQYIDNYKTLREQLSRRLFKEFNKGVFEDSLDADMPIIWDTKLRSTAGTTTNRLIKNARCERIRTSTIKLSTKVVDAPQRLRDTLIHELCHAATWLVDGELRAGHGPLWKKWASRAIKVFPELGEISRCHNLEIHFKYSYKCTKCGYSIKRHSKSIDVMKKCCGYCRGTFEIIVNKKNKDGVVVSTPARKGGPNDFALYVKENYGTLKDGTRTHAQVMKLLGEQFSAKKTAMENSDNVIEVTEN